MANKSKQDIKKRLFLASLVTLIIALALVCVHLLLLTLFKPVSENDLKDLGLNYAISKCKEQKGEDKFCDNLYVEVGGKNEDIGRDFWIIDVHKKQDRDFYASFVINSKSSGLKVDESTYSLTYGK